MKNSLLLTLATFVLGNFLSLEAEIIETAHFHELKNYVKSDILVILDIDDTLLIPSQMLGCDEWFLERLKKYQEEMNYTEALEKALAEWESIRHLSKMDLVEPDTNTIIQELQSQGHCIMGLTTQGLALATRTKIQLKENQIDLLTTAPSQQDYYLELDGHGVLYRNGILFTSGRQKGKALFQLLDMMGYSPRKIVFVNDKATHLAEIEVIAKQRRMEFIGLRYAHSDARKAKFSSALAEIQFKNSSFDHILSDEEARLLLNTHRGIDGTN